MFWILSLPLSLSICCLIFSCCTDQVECGGLQRSYRRAPRSAKEGKDASFMAGISSLVSGWLRWGWQWVGGLVPSSKLNNFFFDIVYIVGFCGCLFSIKDIYIYISYILYIWYICIIQHDHENISNTGQPRKIGERLISQSYEEVLPEPWDEESPWTQNLMTETGLQGKARFFKVDIWHVVHMGVAKRLHQFSAVPCTSAFRRFKRWLPFPAHDNVVQRLVQKKQEDQVLDQTDKGYSRRLWKAWRTCCGLEQSCSQYNFDGVHWLLVWPLQGAMWARWASTYGRFLTYVNLTRNLNIHLWLIWILNVKENVLTNVRFWEFFYIHEPAEHMGNWRQVQQGLWISLCLASIMLTCGSLAWRLLESWNMASTSWRHTAI